MSDETQTPAKRPFDAERKFIHDISTPATTIHLLVETCAENLKKLCEQNPALADALRAEATRLSKALDASQKLNNKLHERHKALIAASAAAEVKSG